MPCINILAHLYRWVQRSCSSALAGSGERPWAGPSGWVPGRLMDGARPPRPTEFYLRLTSRCCCGCSARSASLINLSLPSTRLNQSASTLPALSSSSSPALSSDASYCISASSSEAAGFPPLSATAVSPHRPDKQGGGQTPTQIHTSTHTHLFTAWQIGGFDGCCLPPAGVNI